MNKIPNNISTSNSQLFFIALTVAILTTGFLRLQLFTGLKVMMPQDLLLEEVTQKL
jgi:hypothetical protein